MDSPTKCPKSTLIMPKQQNSFGCSYRVDFLITILAENRLIQNTNGQYAYGLWLIGLRWITTFLINLITNVNATHSCTNVFPTKQKHPTLPALPCLSTNALYMALTVYWQCWGHTMVPASPFDIICFWCIEVMTSGYLKYLCILWYTHTVPTLNVFEFPVEFIDFGICFTIHFIINLLAFYVGPSKMLGKS